MSSPRPWHRLFGLAWLDFLEGTGIEVDLEIDLSARLQFLDMVITRLGGASLPSRMPDGFEFLAPYNLVTFKSYQEVLDEWAMLELIGHYVNYRKQISPSLDNLLPVDHFRLFAVTARFPQQLDKMTMLRAISPGVYEMKVFSRTIKVIVVCELPQEEQNAMLHLFSAQPELIRYGQTHHRPRSEDTSKALLRLFQTYREDKTMPEKLKEFVRQTIAEMFASLSTEERLEGLPPEELLKRIAPEELRKHLPVEERLKGISPEERLEGLTPEERLKGLSVEDLLKALTPEAREALLQQRKPNGASPKPD